MEAYERIFCALDTVDLETAINVAKKLKGLIGGVKLGKEFFTANGPAGIAAINQLKIPVFLDLKFHDIPNTVSGAIRALTGTGCTMTTIHASGGPAMIRAAVKSRGSSKIKILAVTVLTSLSEDDMASIGQKGPIHEQVLRLAKMAVENGADGIVASPLEVPILRSELGSNFTIVVPGIRPSWTTSDDQKRTMTPTEAVSSGADFLVIGRPITEAENPEEAAALITHEIKTI
ncbi:MAG: orotidine-5'-phosphate decarboxylase [Rhodospirillaceae bacterium]